MERVEENQGQLKWVKHFSDFNNSDLEKDQQWTTSTSKLLYNSDERQSMVKKYTTENEHKPGTRETETWCGQSSGCVASMGA